MASFGVTALVALRLFSAQASAGSTTDARTLSRYLSEVWQTEDGLPQNAIQAIAQSHDGYLWFGTPGGLVRFDGVRFTVFNQGQFRNNNIHALLEDRAGRLWIGTYGGGIYRHENGRFVAVEGLEGNLIRTLYETRDGTLWVGTHGGGVSYWKDNRFHTLRMKDGLTSDIVRVIYEDGAGRLWIGTNASGLNLWTGKGVVAYAVKPGRLTPYAASDALSNDNVLALLDDHQGGLWIGTDGSGLWRLTGPHGDLLARSAAEITGVRRLMEDADGDTWIGTDGGGIRRLRNGRFEAITSRDGLPSDIVLSLFEDRERNLWAGTRDGLLRLKNGKFIVYTTKNGLANDFITALHGSRDGALWVGTRVGLDRFDTARVIAAPLRASLPRDIVLSLLEDRSGVLWVGTLRGLFRVDRNGTRRFSTADGLQGNYVAALAQARDGGIWVGTHAGLDHLKDGHIRQLPAPRDVPLDVTAIYERGDGTIWVGTDGAGVARFADGGWHFFDGEEGLAHAGVTALYDDGESLWVTSRQGLNRFRDGRLHHYTAQKGLPSNQLFAIVDDRRGALWLTSYAGIFRVDTKSIDELDAGRRPLLGVTTYGKTDGMKSSECNSGVQPAAWRDADGRLWFATVKGLAVIDPAHIPWNAQPPPVAIEEVRVDDEAVSAEQARALPPGRTRLEFHYTALSFSSPARVRFRYQLEGFDAGWVDAGSRRVAFYTNLPAGQYRFRVIASNEDGVWNQAGAAFEIGVRARFYRTVAFWIACAGALGMLGLVFYRLRVRRLKAQFAAVLAERNRIAREIHDTLAQSFVGIGVQLETVAKLQTASPEEARRRLDRARILVRSSLAESRRTVWNLRSQALESSDLPGALRAVAEQLSGDSEVAVRINGPCRRMSADVEDNLLRIGQEALANAVRHAQAQSIRIDLTFGDGYVRLGVQDDGCGFDVECAARSGNGHFGLAGMRERVRHLGGELHVVSEVGRGTEVIVDVPIGHRYQPS